ncbi:MAG TPA: hypothetical protein DCE41_04020 [Cytophagales bacterium]|nr:hypothetical protein [Cytophagales bacterium]HAA20810.1 hypothetical protein [Cytophagales bacterium]HAP59099.1 hypothetical protein [Cytophagales bacterium]
MNYIYAGTGTIILFFVTRILQKKEKKLADYLLVAINIVIGLFLLADVGVREGLTSFRIIFQNVLPLVLFPLFILYVLQFIRPKQSMLRWGVLFFPAAGLVIYSWVDHVILGNYPTVGALEEHFNDPTWVYQAFFKGSQLIFISILIWVIRQFPAFERRLKEGYSDIETINLRWLRNFTWTYLLSIAITFVSFLGQNLGLIPYEIQEVFGLVYGLLVLSVFYLNYEGIKHYTLAQEATALVPEKPLTDLDSEPKEGELVQVAKSVAREEDQEVHARMKRLFEEEHKYLISKYGLRDLAEDLQESTHTISRVINTVEKKSFYDLVNGYRVEHLIALMKDSSKSKYTILALGLESGFNSKASINRIFKKVTGSTPKEYLQQES